MQQQQSSTTSSSSRSVVRNRVVSSSSSSSRNGGGGGGTVHTTRVLKQLSASSSLGPGVGENRTVTETTVTTASDPSAPGRVRTVTTTRVVSSPRIRTKISDIITGSADETLTARDALLKWVQRTTERYPGVRVTDFTNSWKDGLAFNAILHRNRPDLLDFRSLRTRSAKDNLESAFSLAEREFGITRLLDPEDVDTPEPDEKSLITYISSMYDVFPEPPSHHPFGDDEKNRKVQDYIELANNLLIWIRDSLEMFSDKKMINTVIDMKALLLEFSKFRSDELPKRLRDKQRLSQLYREVQKIHRDSGPVEIERKYRMEEVEQKWNHLTTAMQEKDQKIRDEICRLEKLQRLAEKLIKESKQCDSKLDELEKRIKEEEKRMNRLHPMDTKHSCDQIESELKQVDDFLKSAKKDLAVLENKKYHQICELKQRIEILSEKHSCLKATFQSVLLDVLLTKSGKTDDKKIQRQKIIEQKIIDNGQKASDVNSTSYSLKEHFDWIDKKQKRVSAIEFGNDSQSAKANLDQMKMENKAIEQYKKRIELCSSQKNTLKGSDQEIYCHDLEKLQHSYRELVNVSVEKLQNLEVLLDFIHSVSKEMKWLAEKEEVEVSRDWGAKSLNLVDLEHYQENLTSDLEKHEIQMNILQNKGESLLFQKHPASKCIESYLNNMQSQWSWLLQLTLCLEIHLRYAQGYHQFFKEARECDQWIRKVEEKLNTTFSKNISSVDEGERFLKQMQSLKEDLARYSDIIVSLVQRSTEVIPLKARKLHHSKPIKVTSVCKYKRGNVEVSKDDQCILKDNSQKNLWKIKTTAGVDCTVPGVCFVIPAPNTEALELGESIKKRYDDTLNLWLSKHKKMRQNLILATIKTVKTWDDTQLRSMDVTQRECIMRALNEDTQKLISEGSSSEPVLIKLREEMNQCNVMFSSMLQKMTEDETKVSQVSPKTTDRKLTDVIASFQTTVNEKEKFLKSKLQTSITWDLDSLENLVIEHKEFEVSLRSFEDQMDEIVQSYSNTSKKSTTLQNKYDNLRHSWDKLWDMSNIYVERLKAVEVGLFRLNEAVQVVSGIEVQLASCDNLQSNNEDLHKLHDMLLSTQIEMQHQQPAIDDVQESLKKLKSLVQHIRSKHGIRTDVSKFENDVKKLTNRWDNACSQIVERLRSCGASSELLRSYKTKVEKDNVWITETTVKVNNSKSVKRMTAKEITMAMEPAINLYSSIVERSSSIEETNTLGERFIREAQEAVSENYKICNENASKLFSWMRDVETRLSTLGVLKETLPELQHQINYAKVLKDELEHQQHLVTSTLDQMRQLVQQGLEILKKDEINQLQKNVIALKKQYDSVLTECDRILRRLMTALEELRKFKMELDIFKEWLNKAQFELKKKEIELGNLNKLDENIESFRVFSNDVIAHQADLRFITMVTQKFTDESQEYLKALNIFRSSLPQSLPPIKPVESEVKAEVQEVTTIYHNLLNNVNRLTDHFSVIRNKYHLYMESSEKAKIWIVEIKKTSKKSLEEPTADEPRAVQEQLDRMKLINMEVVSQSRLIDQAFQAAKILTNAVDIPNASAKSVQSIENCMTSLQEDYSELMESIMRKIEQLQLALIRSQDIQDGLDRTLKWLDETEVTMNAHSRPISLIVEKLEEQKQGIKILTSDVNNQKQSIEMLNASAKELMNSANAKLAKKLESKLNDIAQRYSKLTKKVSERAELIGEISDSVQKFDTEVMQFEEWISTTFERIEGADIVHLDVDGFTSAIEYTVNHRNSKKDDFEQTIKIAKNLISKKDVTDVSLIKNKIKSLEQQWKHLDDILSEKKQLAKRRAEQMTSYTTLRVKVLDWLLQMERSIEKLEPVALDQTVLKKQASEIMPLAKDCSDFGATVEKINNMGNSCDALVKGDSSRRKISSPDKKMPSPTQRSPSKSKSGESFSASPVKGQLPTQSPLSTASSGFSSRRSSTDNIVGIDDVSPIQHQLSEINSRYSLLCGKISDQTQEINSTIDEVKSCLECKKKLDQFIDTKDKLLSKDKLPKEFSESHFKLLKETQEEMLEKQSEVDQLKTNVKNLLLKRKGVKGSPELQEGLSQTENNWASVLSNLKQYLAYLQDLKDFNDSHELLINWLTQRQKMFQVLGPIASEPRMVSAQVSQVQVMKDEFTTQKAFLDRYDHSGNAVLLYLQKTNSSSKKVTEGMKKVHQMWVELTKKLEERERSLEAANGVVSDFHKSLIQLQEKLQFISDSYDSVLETNLTFDVLLKKLYELETDLESQRSLLTDADTICEQLSEIISDSTSKTEIKYKISMLEKLYNNLRKKIDNKKAEIKSNMKDDEAFYKSCEDVQRWLKEFDQIFSQTLYISANLNTLTTQAREYEPTYKQVMNKEHEVHLCLSRGADMLPKLGKQEATALKTKLDDIKKLWDKLKKTAIDRHTNLQSCLENCKKYHSSVDTFLPWLEVQEEKTKSFKPISFKRDILNKQLKEAQSFKNDISIHFQAFENIQHIGENLVSNCQIEKDSISKQMDSLNKRWTHLNNGVGSRIQSLEDMSQILMEYQEKIRDLQHAIQRLEDRLASHEMLADVSRDPIVMDRLKTLLKETTLITKELKTVRTFLETVISKAEKGADTSEIRHDLDVIEKRHQTLTKKLEERCSNLTTASEVYTVFMDQVKHLRTDINSLDETFDRLSPIARDKDQLRKQLLEIKEFKARISKAKESIANSELQCQNMVTQGYMSDTKTFEEQLKIFSRQITRLEEHIKSRESSIEITITRIETFTDVYNKTRSELNAVLKEEEKFGSIGGDVDVIRSQQASFKKFRSDKISSLSKQISEVNKVGQGIVQSAATGLDTSHLEQQLEKINDSWNNLQERVNEREKKLDIALLQSGKYQEALSGVQKWLKDTEEMVCNQKPPSADFKVVKAQIQEQKFLKKMLLDRQISVVSLKDMGAELKHDTKNVEDKQAEDLMKNIFHRFEELITTAQSRMTVLEKTIPVTQELQKVSSPLTEWMETTEKKLLSMSVIPVEEKSVKSVMVEHKKISEDIAKQKISIEQLNSISHKLSKMISREESESLTQKVHTYNQQYTEIVNTDKKIASALKEAVKGTSKFSTSYSSTISWIEKTSTILTKYQTISVYSDKLQIQVKELKKLKDDLNSEQSKVEEVITSGKELMKHASGEDAIQLKEKLDALNVQFVDLTNRANERLKTAEESLPLVQSFYNANTKVLKWLDTVERTIKTIDSTALNVQEETIQKLQSEIVEYRNILETLNHTGPRLCQLSSDDGTAVIESIMSRANQRFDSFCEQVQRKAERIELSVRRKFDVVGDVDEIFDWFQEMEKQVSESEGLSSEPESLLSLLKQQKSVNEEVNSQKNRVRDIITAAKKLMRESSSEDLSFIREKVENLKTLTTNVSTLCQDKLGTLEQALPLAEHFFETHNDLGQWLDEVEGQAELLEAPALNSVQIRKQQDRNKGLVQSVHEHKPLVDKLNKTGSALTKLCKEEETDKLEIILESDNSRYNALRQILREHQSALEEALQATSQFSDKLEGMLNALTSTADQLHNAEPISAHPERIQEQINDNKAVLHDLDKRTITLEAVKKAADDVITKASTIDEPAVRDIKIKLDRLNDLWTTIQTAALNRGKSLEEALVAAEKFWDELTAVMKALKELQVNLNNQEPPAVVPTAVQKQQVVLQEIKQEITQTKPEVDHCRKAGQNLMQLCGEPDKPEVKKHIEDLDSVWDNVTTLYAKREQNLVAAMEKAMTFHNTLQNILEFLDTFEDSFSKLGAVSSDIDSVKSQIDQLKDFKLEVDPHMVEVESLNRQAQELMERTAPNQSTSIRKPLAEINRRWDELLKNIVNRQQDMENTLLKLGQFQHALEQLMTWISKTEKTIDELKPVFGDPQVIEVVLAKHKVITNDIQAHQSSMDTINRTGRQYVSSNQGSEESKYTHNMIQNLNTQWQQLQDKSANRQKELEEALKEAQQFHQDIQDLLMWLSDLDGHLVTSKPVGGLPETAKEQLNRFMDMYNELDANRYKVENILKQGQEYTNRSGESSTKGLQHNLKTLKQRWDSILNKANDRKIKLEIALREATEFNEALQTFVEWLTNAEKYLTTLKPVSRCMKSVLEQIEEHRSFQKDVGSHREVMLNLDKKGTHLKYFSQKQDVILIKNLLISVQHRWERIVSKAAERTRALDHGYKESKEFHDSWTHLISWLDEAEKVLDDPTPIGNDPFKIKKLISKHKEFQRTLGSKQVTYDNCMKVGRSLKDKCPKQDVQFLQDMMDELKLRWNKVCAKAVDKQRKLEEALLYSGQFKEAVLALLDWFDKALASLSENKLYHGDLDTVNALVDKHRAFMEELKKRGQSFESVRNNALDLEKSASPADSENIASQIHELETKWKTVSDLSERHRQNLNEALQQAEKLHKAVHMLLEWLSDAEIKLRFIGPLPEDEEATKKQISDHNQFLKEMEKQEINKNSTLELAQLILKKCHPDGVTVIKNWITVIQSRWEEISVWARQRNQRLQDHLLSLRSIIELLEELIAWLTIAESTLTTLEAEPLPDDKSILENLIKEHQIFMDGMSKKQPDVEKVTKAFSTKRHQSKNVPQSSVKEKPKERGSRTLTPVPLKTSTPMRHQTETDIKHPRAKFMLDKWRTVWLLAMERQRRLQDKYNYLLELDRIKHFDFNDWRRRYLGWLNNKKSRIMDQFKKIDKDNNGKVTKQEFIEGIVKSKFSTSRPEMEHVANIFDRNEDGYVDSKEYIETLRPEKEEGPLTEAEKIQDEVQRQVAKCTCVHRFKVYQVGEGKYRFGDSQKLRLVRILRSTVMVRVGGGWVALDEFLVKNDPCRAKGRTNLELREQFILADGVSQSMTPFKPKQSPNSSVSSQSGVSPKSGNSLPSAGPITKIREKSERSTPMRQSRCSGENSSDISGPSFNESDSFSSRSGFSRNTPSSTRISSPRNKPPSRPISRHGSRPSSRAPSDLSQDAVDECKKKSSSNRQNSAKHSTSESNISRIPAMKKSASGL